jgi:hypothetical protein
MDIIFVWIECFWYFRFFTLFGIFSGGNFEVYMVAHKALLLVANVLSASVLSASVLSASVLSASVLSVLVTPVFADGSHVSLSTEACRHLSAHTPAVGVTFTPGVDVAGKAIAPADIQAPSVQVPKTIELAVKSDIGNQAVAAGRLELKIPLPTIGFDLTSKQVSIDGVVVGAAETNGTAGGCLKQRH